MSDGCLVDVGAYGGHYRDGGSVLPAEDSHEHGAEALVSDEVDDWVDEGVNIIQHVCPRNHVDGDVADVVGEHERQEPDGQPADEEHQRDDRTRDRNANGAPPAAGCFLLLCGICDRGASGRDDTRV